MSERETQSGDGEVAVCHVCQRAFSTQKELLELLVVEHDGVILD